MTTKTAFASLVLALLAGTASAQQMPASPVAVQDKTQPSPRLNNTPSRADQRRQHGERRHRDQEVQQHLLT